MSRICKHCNIEKSFSMFNLAYGKPKAMCKDCQKIKNLKYYQSIKDNYVVCECGAVVKDSNKYEHKKTILHKYNMTKLTQ